MNSIKKIMDNNLVNNSNKIILILKIIETKGSSMIKVNINKFRTMTIKNKLII